MTDILITDNNSELKYSEGDFITTNNLEEIKQKVIIALNTMPGDWYLNSNKGINYAYDLRNTEFLEHDVRRQILGVNKVQSINYFDVNYDRETFTIKISAILKTVYGEIDINENLKMEI